ARAASRRRRGCASTPCASAPMLNRPRCSSPASRTRAAPAGRSSRSAPAAAISSATTSRWKPACTTSGHWPKAPASRARPWSPRAPPPTWSSRAGGITRRRRAPSGLRGADTDEWSVAGSRQPAAGNQRLFLELHMNEPLNKKALPKEEQAVLDRFLADNRLFLGPDPEIMRNHALAPRTEEEDRVLKKGLDAHQVHHIRGLINAALSEAFQMVNQMGAAPGAKWGDLVTGIYTTSGDLAMIAPHGIIAFAACCFYPIKFINKYWMNDPTVGVKDGDGFIHNDARYGGIHNTDQSMMMPLYYKGELVCWLSSTIHEGENGACEPGGMPAAAESKYDEGIKMSPFKVVENFQIKRDLLTFLQNSVRDPKLQLEDMKVKLHAVIRLRERIVAILDQYGREALVGTLRSHLEDVETEMRRRIRELPDGTTRVNAFMDSSLRENCMQKITLALTVKGDRMILDFRGTAPQFLNRAVNTNIASFKAALCTGLLQNIWPDLPHTMAVLSPIEIISDRNSIIDAE